MEEVAWGGLQGRSEQREEMRLPVAEPKEEHRVGASPGGEGLLGGG